MFLSSARPAPKTIGSFVKRNTPGNVGVCISGGGSRSFAAGIGQLKALEDLQANGASLLSQTRALATVSGGGWIGIPFTLLPPANSDSDFLGSYVTPAGLTRDGLNVLPPDGIAGRIASRFSITSLALQAVMLICHGARPSDVWQILMAQTFLKPYGLYKPRADHEPTQFFSYDAASLAQIQSRNPDLNNEDASLFSQASGQQ